MSHDGRACYGDALRAAVRWLGRTPSCLRVLRAGGPDASKLRSRFSRDGEARCYLSHTLSVPGFEGRQDALIALFETADEWLDEGQPRAIASQWMRMERDGCLEQLSQTDRAVLHGLFILALERGPQVIGAWHYVRTLVEAQFGLRISHKTVGAAYRRLEAAGLIEVMRGKPHPGRKSSTRVDLRASLSGGSSAVPEEVWRELEMTDEARSALKAYGVESYERRHGRRGVPKASTGTTYEELEMTKKKTTIPEFEISLDARANGITSVHPIARWFPPPSEDEYEALRRDIAKNGLRQEIVVDEDGKIVDGLHRYLACAETGMPLRVQRITGDVAAHVFSHNLLRRSLTTTQRAMLGVQLYYEFRGRDMRRTEKEIARDVGVGFSTLKRAKHVYDHKKGLPGRPLADDVVEGSLSLKEAVDRISADRRGERPQTAGARVRGRLRPVEPVAPVESPSKPAYLERADLPDTGGEIDAGPFPLPRVSGRESAAPEDPALDAQPEPTDWVRIARELDVPREVRADTHGLPNQDALRVALSALDAGLSADAVPVVLKRVRAAHPEAVESWARRVAMGDQ